MQADVNPSRARVLLVDDQADSRLLISTFLRQSPIELEQVTDGKQAIERATNQHYDLILMDVHMPGMDGLSATRAIRADELNCGRHRVPILALTADDSDEDRALSAQAGCNEHLVKPIRRKVLLEALSRWLSN